jgi:hypothetical protein
MGGGKSSAPATPDYSSIAASDTQAAQIEAQTSSDQLAWSKQQYAQEEPYTQAYMTAATNSMNAENTSAADQQAFYNTTYQPIESQFAGEASGWNTPARAETQSASAQADVASAFTGQRQAAQQSLESYGIDPSQTRYGALDLGSRISQAAAQAAAGTQSTLNTQATGLALQGEAINIGRGYPGSIAQSYSTASGAGSAGVTAGLNTSSTYGNMMGTPTQWAGLSTNSNNAATNTMNTSYNNQLAGYQASNAIAAQQSGGIGSLVGGLGMAGILAFSDERMKKNIEYTGEILPRSGIPIVEFTYKGEHPRVRHRGVIAQQVERAIPSAVYRTPTGMRMVDYAKVH